MPGAKAMGRLAPMPMTRLPTHHLVSNDAGKLRCNTAVGLTEGMMCHCATLLSRAMSLSCDTHLPTRLASAVDVIKDLRVVSTQAL